jgi:hypothetical protein
MPLRLLQLQLSCRFYCGGCYCHSHCCCAGGLFQNTYCCEYRICQQHCYRYYGHCLIGLPLLLLAAITIVVRKNVSQQYYIYLFCFALSMMIVSLMAKTMAMTMVMATGMIYHCLFHDSHKMIVAIIYFSFFS